MRPIRVKKAELLRTVLKNREAHRAIFLEAVEGYRREVLRLLEERIALIKKSRLPRSVSIALYVPEDHTKDYDNAIAMFDWSIDDEIEIDEASFIQLVRDDWSWKRAWLSSNAGYSSSAAASLQAGGEEDDGV